MPPKKSDKNGIRTKKALKRGGSRNAELEEEEPGVYPPIPWYAGEERNYSRYTWKSKLDEAVERIRVQTTLFYEIIFININKLSSYEAFNARSLLQRIINEEFYTDVVRSVLSFYKSVENEDNNTPTAQSRKRGKQRVPDVVLSYLQSIPTKVKEMEPSVFDLYKLQQFVYTLPQNSQLLQHIDYALKMINFYRIQYMSLSDLTNFIENDKEPYSQFYHPAVHAARSFISISDYILTESVDQSMSEEVMNKLENTSTLHCDGECDSSPAVLNHLTFQFQSSCPCASSNRSCTEQCTCGASNAHNQLNDYDSLVLGHDLIMRDTWGFDCYTRSLIQSILAFHGASPEEVDRFFQFCLYPAVNIIRKEYSHDIRNSLIYILVRNKHIRYSVILLQCFLFIGPNHFRVHPKGKGVICNKKDGISANRIICRYLGEVYPPWAWFEKQDILKQKLRELNLLHYLPEFYNIVLERPVSSVNGYDVLYIDPIFRGNFGSRLSHSCKPNCATTTVTINNRLAIVLVALRDIHCGEELTFDYSCVSESREEFEKATCLCGDVNCRGSFVSYADDSSFMQVMNRVNSFLKQTSRLLDACSETLTNNDVNALYSAGIKKCMLDKCPDWLIKWTVKVLEYMRYEEESLPVELVDLTDRMGRKLYESMEMVKSEARGVFNSRLQNLAITLDKIKHFLYRQPDHLRDALPMKLMTENEIMAFLWNDKNSVLKRLCNAGQQAFRDTDPDAAAVFIQLRQDLHYSNPSSLAAIKEKMIEVRSQLLALGGPTSRHHIACADCLSLYIHTHTWFTVTDYQKILSDPIALHTYDLPCSCSTTYRLQEGCSNNVSFDLSSYSTLNYQPPVEGSDMFVGEVALNCEEEVRWMLSSDADRLKETERVISYSQKAYNKQYIWGQLSAWYKQNVNDPCAMLANDRKGCLLLPSLESCYTNLNHVNMNYTESMRGKLIERIENHPSQSWSVKFPWTYNNQQVIYGSPMFDAVRGDSTGLQETIKELKSIPYIAVVSKEDVHN